MLAKRIATLAVILVLSLFLGVLGNNVLVQLRGLSIAETDNMQWTILQVETEIANLQVAVLEALTDDNPDLDAVRLRSDIALSRLGPVQNGRTGELFRENAQAMPLLAAIDAFAASLIGILDTPGRLDRVDLVEMRELIVGIRPDVRQLALFGLQLGVERSEARRVAFSDQLWRTGATAIALIAALGVLLLVLDRVLARARQRDLALRASSDRLVSTVEASLDAIVAADQAGRIVQFNSAAERIFGWTNAEILGRKMDETIIPPQHRNAHKAGMDRYLATHEAHVVGGGRVELSALRKTGEEFPVEINITSVRDGAEELFIAYLRDISLRKINEQKLIDARDRALRMDRAKSQFLAVMSHEMRTPLNGVLGVLDLLRTTKLTERQERYVGVAAASGEILLEHVNEALDITRIEMGSMSLSPAPFPLRRCVEGVVDVLSPLAQERNLALELEFGTGMDRHFLADGGRIAQMLTNLVGNAIKFTDAGSIHVSVTGIHGADATSATFAVRDTGPGISPENHERIFEDFVALAHAEGRQSRGDGLGLSIARKTARLMGGDLTVTSKMGEGSTFSLVLPLERVSAPADAATPELTHTRPVSARSILVVEDNAINRSVLHEMLKGLGHSVQEAKDGLEGLNAAKNCAVDLIIMDISMPVMDGIEATRRIRQEAGPNQSTPILGLTAHGREEYRTQAEQAGMTAFCTKPIRLAVLQEVLSGLDRADLGPVVSIDGVVLREMIDALGVSRARTTLDRFRSEFDDGIALLLQETETGVIAEMPALVHKLRGAAAMIGLTGIVVHLDVVSDAMAGDDPAALTSAIQSLRHAANAAQGQALDILSTVR